MRDTNFCCIQPLSINHQQTRQQGGLGQSNKQESEDPTNFSWRRTTIPKHLNHYPSKTAPHQGSDSHRSNIIWFHKSWIDPIAGVVSAWDAWRSYPVLGSHKIPKMTTKSKNCGSPIADDWTGNPIALGASALRFFKDGVYFGPWQTQLAQLLKF